MGTPAVVSCSLLVNWDEFDRSTADAAVRESGADSELPTDGPVDIGEGGEGGDNSDGGPDADSDIPDVSPPPRCVAEAGPILVPLGNTEYCIDRTEVTVSDYRAFLLARAGDISGQRADCTDNVLVPVGGLPPPGSSDQLPVTNVDFCDALAFCDWAGKRLCGAVDGGPVLPADATNAKVDHWYRACSRNEDGLHRFPYGQTFDGTACNMVLFDAGGPRGPLVVGSLPRCEGGYPNLFDLSGNVDEWEDSCADSDGGPACMVRGGSFNSGVASGCESVRFLSPKASATWVGFRCCSR